MVETLSPLLATIESMKECDRQREKGQRQHQTVAGTEPRKDPGNSTSWPQN